MGLLYPRDATIGGAGVDQAIAASRRGRGKSELHRAVCLVTRGRGDPTESATENIPPRVERGKGEKVR
jgi:hypothetical protein